MTDRTHPAGGRVDVAVAPGTTWRRMGPVTPGLLVQLVLATSVLTLGVMLAAVGALLPGVACCLGAGAWLARSLRRL